MGISLSPQHSTKNPQRSFVRTSGSALFLFPIADYYAAFGISS